MLKFAVKNQSLMRLDRFRAAEDSVNYLVAEFDILTDDWDGATITATFSNGEKTVDAVLIENRCLVPWEVLVKPVPVKVSLFGVKGDKIITTDICSFSNSCTQERGSSGEDPTPDAYQQIVNMIEAGKVKGPQGDPGPQGPRGETGQTGPQGPRGETGQRGPQGEIGQTGQTGPAGQDGHTPVKGVDYWTASDKQEIYAEAEQALRDQEQSSVAAIREAGADEVEKVQIKGTEVLESIPEDYSALTAEVSGLKSDLVELDSRLSESITEIDGLLFVYGKNLLNPNIPSDHSGKFINPSNGAINTNADYSYTDFCGIPSDTIILYCKSNTGNIVTQAFIAFYDKGKNFISGASSAAGVQSFTVPSNAKYFVWSAKTSRMNGTEYKTMVSADANDVYEDYTGKGFNYKKIDARNDIIVVAKERGQYTSVTEAVQNAKDGDTILVYPSVYDNETVEAWGKEVHIIGLSCERCIIKNHEATYSTPPIEIGKGTLENLTIIAEYGSGVSKDSNGWFPYAVHSEDNNLENGVLTIRNCILISELNAAFGLGMRGGCTVNIDNCEMIGRNGSGNRSLFFHDSASATYKGEQNINIVNSQLISSSASQHTLRIVDQNVDGSRVNARFVNTLVYNSSNASARLGTSVEDGATGSGWRNLVNVYLDGASYGNSVSAMNAV